MGEPLICAYNQGMSSIDLGRILAERLRDIRSRVSGTQEEFSEATGYSQGQISRLESAQHWKAIRRLGDAIEQAGGDPLDLLREPQSQREQEVKIARLLSQLDEETLDFVQEFIEREVRRGLSRKLNQSG
jgi:transcriptional regulator with XRE-family HTH domain